MTSLYWFDSATNGGEYVPTWTIRTGTDADDQVRWAGINRDTGYVILAGETEGVFDQQQGSGGRDSFLQRIDTELDGNTQQPAVAWTRQAGSAADDRVAGGSTESVNPGLFGSAAGSVEGASVIGGIDAFFFNASSATSELDVKQVGTTGDEPVSNGLYTGSTLWLIGASDGSYSVLEQDEEDPVLEREALSSAAGFLLRRHHERRLRQRRCGVRNGAGHRCPGIAGSRTGDGRGRVGIQKQLAIPACGR